MSSSSPSPSPSYSAPPVCLFCMYKYGPVEAKGHVVGQCSRAHYARNVCETCQQLGHVKAVCSLVHTVGHKPGEDV